jgi:hypothetical protein
MQETHRLACPSFFLPILSAKDAREIKTFPILYNAYIVYDKAQPPSLRFPVGRCFKGHYIRHKLENENDLRRKVGNRTFILAIMNPNGPLTTGKKVRGGPKLKLPVRIDSSTQNRLLKAAAPRPVCSFACYHHLAAFDFVPCKSHRVLLHEIVNLGRNRSIHAHYGQRIRSGDPSPE